MKKVVVYDIETLASCFTYTDINVHTQEINQFVIHESCNDLKKLVEHLLSLDGQIGFNNLSFDYPVLHFILTHYDELYSLSAPAIINAIYNTAQDIINLQSSEDKKYSGIKDKFIKIHQMDLFKMWHYNNKARSTSLKSLQISMNYPNVLDMPIDHSCLTITNEQVKDILKYNLNDVLSTYEFYKKSNEKINLRKELIGKYNISAMNYSDSKIGEELILKLYCEKTGLDLWDIKKLRTIHPYIDLKDCIFDYIKFESKEFNDLLNKLKSKRIYTTKGAIEYDVIYKGFQYFYGTGGIHGSIKSGIYEENDEYIIRDADVGSLYPSIAVVNKLFPAHLGDVFCEVYESILKERIKAKKEGNMVVSDGLKLSLNSVYGKSNDKYSFLQDSVYTMKTTLNGQLMLTMLTEKLVNNIPDLTMLQINTDGLTVRMKRSSVETYDKICKDWEDYTKLSLEYVDYKKMIIGDVNNYYALSTKGKIKYKGRFEVDKVVGSEPAYHKDNSFRIVKIALNDFFFKQIPVEDTVKNHRNIYDFCGREKFTKDSCGETHEIIKDGNGLPVKHVKKQQKNVRFYVSKGGKTFVKRYDDESLEMICKGFSVTIFNEYVKKEWDNYQIDYSFYIKECYKEINNIMNNQLELF